MARKRTDSYRSEESEQEAGTEYQDVCGVPVTLDRELPADITADRASLILALGQKWVNGTVLHYYFFDDEADGREVVFTDGSRQWRTWKGADAQKNVVRRAFKAWKDVGLGLEFTEVTARSEAEIRIGFEQGDGAWSYIGRDILGIGTNERTMNFGWSLTRSPRELDTAIHEIGHTIGLPHEHQNPIAGIVWNEEAVYAALAQPPNRWDRAKTFHNIIRKIPADTVQGSSWDPDSVMEYPFNAGLIREPVRFVTGLTPAGGLSTRDKTWARTFYPPIARSSERELKPFMSDELGLNPGEQRNYAIHADETREYEMRTFGTSDVVMVLFEDLNGEWRYVAGEDDGGEARNASIQARLFKGRSYMLRIRLYAQQSAGAAVMMW